MNIALLIKNFNQFEKDAAVTTVINLAKFLKNKGHNPIIISERGFKNYLGYEVNPAYEIINDIEVFRPYWIPWFRTKNWFLDPTVMFNTILARALGLYFVQKEKKIRFDIIHSFGAAPFFVLAAWLSKFFQPAAHTIHSIKAISAHKEIDLFQKLYFLPEVITVPLISMKNKLIKQGIAKEKIYLLHSFIDFAKFYPKNKINLRKKYHYGKQPIILYFGPLGPYKGTDYLLKAIARIHMYLPDVKIILAHPAYFTARQKKHIAKFNINNCIEIIEKKIKIEDYINMADAIALPYATLAATEANPLCLLESMACKTPIVTTDLPELKEIVRQNIDVLMARPRDADSLAEKLIGLLNNQLLQKKLAENAFKTVQKFNISCVGRYYLGIYDRLMSKRI